MFDPIDKHQSIYLVYQFFFLDDYFCSIEAARQQHVEKLTRRRDRLIIG